MTRPGGVYLGRWARPLLPRWSQSVILRPPDRCWASRSFSVTPARDHHRDGGPNIFGRLRGGGGARRTNPLRAAKRTGRVPNLCKSLTLCFSVLSGTQLLLLRHAIILCYAASEPASTFAAFRVLLKATTSGAAIETPARHKGESRMGRGCMEICSQDAKLRPSPGGRTSLQIPVDPPRCALQSCNPWLNNLPVVLRCFRG